MSRATQPRLSRATPELPLKMQAFDDEAVLVSMQDPAGGQPSFTAVAIHYRGLVAMLNLAFEHLWAGAKPLATEGQSGAEEQAGNGELYDANSSRRAKH